VLFQHAISSPNAEDVKLLEDFVVSLEDFKTAYSDMNRFFDIARAFQRVASAVLKSRQSLSGIYDQQTDSLVISDCPYHMPDSYGLHVGHEHGHAHLCGPDMDENSVAMFKDWMISSQPIVDLMNLDFSSCF
jgi:hypothetical protein